MIINREKVKYILGTRGQKSFKTGQVCKYLNWTLTYVKLNKSFEEGRTDGRTDGQSYIAAGRLVLRGGATSIGI